MELSIKKYHKADALGSSDIRTWINTCPEKWLYRKAGENEDTTDSMDFGQLVHTVVLEPEKLKDEFAINPFSSFRTKEAREWKEEMKQAGKIIINPALLSKAESIKTAILNHTGASKIFSGDGENEKSFFWKDAETGLELKYRPDRIKGSSIIDLKTTKDASPKGFIKSVERYQYWIQAGFYAKGFLAQFGKMPKHFFIVAVETAYPFSVAVYEISMSDIYLGIDIVNKTLREIRKAINKGKFYGYNGENEFTELSINNWERARYEEVLSE